MGEAVRRADDEVVERVAGIEVPRRPVGGIGRRRQQHRVVDAGRGPAGRGGDVDGFLHPRLGGDGELDVHVVPGDVAQGVGEHAAVARADALGGEWVRDGEGEHVAVEADRVDSLEPHAPGLRRQLGAQRSGARVPDLGRRHTQVVVVHRPVHRCGESGLPQQPGPSGRLVRPRSRLGTGEARRRGRGGGEGERTYHRPPGATRGVRRRAAPRNHRSGGAIHKHASTIAAGATIPARCGPRRPGRRLATSARLPAAPHLGPTSGRRSRGGHA